MPALSQNTDENVTCVYSRRCRS